MGTAPADVYPGGNPSWPNPWLSSERDGVEEDARADIETLISTGELHCPNRKRPRSVDESMSSTISTWSAVDHLTACPPGALCRHVADLAGTGRIIEACQFALEQTRPPTTCDVRPALRDHLVDATRRYLDAVVAAVAAIPLTDRTSQYSELCWDIGYDGDEYWEFRPATATVTVSTSQIGDKLQLHAQVDVAGAWRADWCALDGWTFGYLWAERWWPRTRLDDLLPRPNEVALAIHAFIEAVPFTGGSPASTGWSGHVRTDRETTELAELIKLATGPAPHIRSGVST